MMLDAVPEMHMLFDYPHMRRVRGKFAGFEEHGELLCERLELVRDPNVPDETADGEPLVRFRAVVPIGASVRKVFFRFEVRFEFAEMKAAGVPLPKNLVEHFQVAIVEKDVELSRHLPLDCE